MNHDREFPSDRLNGFWSSPVATATPVAFASAGQFVFVASMAPQQAVLFSQIYQMAYEQARAKLAPPRHYGRFFSVWN